MRKPTKQLASQRRFDLKQKRKQQKRARAKKYPKQQTKSTRQEASDVTNISDSMDSSIHDRDALIHAAAYRPLFLLLSPTGVHASLEPRSMASNGETARLRVSTNAWMTHILDNNTDGNSPELTSEKNLKSSLCYSF